MKKFEELNTLLLKGVEKNEIIHFLSQEEILLGIYGKAIKITKEFGLDLSFHKDLTQQYFLLVSEKGMKVKKEFVSNTHMYNAIGRIMKNFAINKMGKEKLRAIREQEYQLFMEDDTDNNETVSNHRQMLRSTINSLSGKEKEAAMLRYIEHLPIRRVGEEMEISLSAAKGLVNRGRKKIMEFLKEENHKNIQDVREGYV